MDENRVRQIVNEVLRQTIQQFDILPDAIKQRHLEAMVVFRGLAASRPSGSTEVLAYFATDTNVLSIWNGTAWVSETLTV